MKRNTRTRFIGIDTETTNGFVDADGKLNLSNSLVYDVGWEIIDEKGNTLKSRSYVVEEIFFDSFLMRKAFFADKIPSYRKEIKAKKRIVAPFKTIYFQFLKDRKKYNCHVVFAHNALFDYKALNTTLRYLTGSKRRFFFPRSLEVWDTLKMSRDVFKNDDKYNDFCSANNYKTNHKIPQNRFTAEILYRFLTNNNDFTESHTGLEDVKIEKVIFLYCLNCGGEIKRALF